MYRCDHCAYEVGPGDRESHNCLGIIESNLEAALNHVRLQSRVLEQCLSEVRAVGERENTKHQQIS